jgi:ferredoxin
VAAAKLRKFNGGSHHTWWLALTVTGGSGACGNCRIFVDVSIPVAYQDPRDGELDMFESQPTGI